MAWKLVMMPHTVPNSPTNGAVEPTVARNSKPPVEPLHLAADGDVHHLLDAHLNAAQRPDRAFHRALPLAHGGHEQRRHGDGWPRDS
jgi:hypothetical protein